MTLEFKVLNGIQRLHASGEVIESDTQVLNEALLHLLESDPNTNVVLDLTNTTVSDASTSSALAQTISTLRVAAAKHGCGFMTVADSSLNCGADCDTIATAESTLTLQAFRKYANLLEQKLVQQSSVRTQIDQLKSENQALLHKLLNSIDKKKPTPMFHSILDRIGITDDAPASNTANQSKTETERK